METSCGISDFIEELKLHIETSTSDETQTWADIETLMNEIDKITQNNRSSAVSFQEPLKLTPDSCKYTDVREQQNHLKTTLRQKERYLATFKKNHREEKERSKKEHEKKIEDEQIAHKTRVKELKQSIESMEKCHKNTIEQLNNDLEMKSASIDLEQDEMETAHRKELIDLCSTTRRHRNMCPDLQDDIKVLQEQIKKREQARIAKTRTTLYPTSRPTSRQQTNRLMNPFCFDNPERSSSSSSHNFSFKKPKPVETVRKPPTDLSESWIDAISDMSEDFNEDYEENRPVKSILKKPALLHTPLFGIPRTPTVKKKKKEDNAIVWKKRKLFDPDNLDYLDQMELGE